MWKEQRICRKASNNIICLKYYLNVLLVCQSSLLGIVSLVSFWLVTVCTAQSLL